MTFTAPPYRDLGSSPVTPVSPPRLWTLALAVVAALVATLVGLGGTMAVFVGVFVVRIVRAGGRPPSALAIGRMVQDFSLTAPGVLASGLVSVLVFGGVAALGGVLSPRGARARLRLDASPRWGLVGLAALGVLVGVGMVSSQVAVALGLSEQGTLPMLRRAFAHMTPPVFVLAVLIVGVGAGVGEELFFRGYLLTRLEERVRPWLAIVAVSFAFGLAHYDPVHSTFAFVIGLGQGWTTRRSGSVRPAVLAHVVNNVIGVVGMSLGGDAPDTWSRLELGGGVALALAGLAGVWFATRDHAD